MITNVDKLKKEAKRYGTDPDELIMLGRENLIKGDYKEARGKFRLALIYNPRLASAIALNYEDLLESDPENINARLSLADLHLYLGEIEGAMGELEEILDISPERYDVYNILGKLYLKQGDTDSAIKLLESAIISGVKDSNLVEMLAGAYVEKDRVIDAINLYKGLLESSPDNKNYLRTLGQLETRMDMVEEAAKSFYSMLNQDVTLISEVIFKLEDLKSKRPDNIKVKTTLAEAYIKAIKPSQAVTELEEVLESDPTTIDGVILKFRDILDKYPDEPSTLKALAKALTIKKEYSESVSEYIRLMRYNNNQYLDDAVNGLKDIILRFPGQVHAHESLGDAYLMMNRVEDALLEYIEVLKLNSGSGRTIIEKCQKVSKENPNMITVHHVMGMAYVLINEGVKALEEAEFMIYLDKNYAPAHQIMGDAYMKLANYPKAQGAYAWAMGLDPYNIILHRRYEEASFAIMQGEISILKKRIDDDPWRLGNHLDIAKLYLMLKDFNSGIKELQTAVKDSARAPFAYNLLGLTFIEMGRFDLAAQQFERALEVMPKELGDISKAVRVNLGTTYEALCQVAPAISQYEIVLAEDMEYNGLQGRIRMLTSINQESQRNRMIALVIERLGEKQVFGLWGPDLRQTETSSEMLSISFGQEHNSTGFEHFIKGRSKGAVEEFSLAVQLQPMFAAALNNLAAMYMKEVAYEQAETRIKHAVSLDPDCAVIHNNLGVYYYLKGDHDQAITELTRALELNPGLSSAYINLGDIMYVKGAAQNAISSWEKVRTNDPLSPVAMRRLAYKVIKA